jgi:hypothetical protein
MYRSLGITWGGSYQNLTEAVDNCHVMLIKADQGLAKASDHDYGSPLNLMSYPVSRN